MFYAGIGSLKTPEILKFRIHKIGSFLREQGYILRSGGAEGFDSMIEEVAGSQKEIFLPWKGFNKNPSPLYGVGPKAMELARKYHPRFDFLSPGSQKCIARDGYQILGRELNSSVEFVICWTEKGEVVGGTGQGMRIAQDYGIPIYNLWFEGKEDELVERLSNESCIS